MKTEAPRIETAGQLAFRALSVRAPVRTQVTLADELGTLQQNVSRWQSGRARPGAVMRKKIARLYGIDPDAWLTADEHAEAEGLTARAS